MSKDLVNDLFNTQQGCNNEPGAGYNRVSEYTNTFAKANELQIHNKTMRTICVKSKDINISGLNSLLIVSAYLMIHDRQSQNRDFIVDWSGALTNWKRLIFKGIEECINTDYLQQTGKSLRITEKGKRLIEDYNLTFEQSKENYLTKAQKRKPKAEPGAK